MLKNERHKSFKLFVPRKEMGKWTEKQFDTSTLDTDTRNKQVALRNAHCSMDSS